jgi:DNA-binding response OmpR family regulator
METTHGKPGFWHWPYAMSPRTKSLAPFKSVLVVEDDPWIRPVLEGVVASIDPSIRVDWFESAEEALVALEARKRDPVMGPYDLVIADIFLEGPGTGLDLWRECEHRFGETPIVVISSLPKERFELAMERDESIPPFLEKPFSLEEARMLLDGYLGK